MTDAGDDVNAECARTVFRFGDDLALHLGPAQKLIAVRSAALLGAAISVNRRRLERLRALLIEKGAARLGSRKLPSSSR